MQKVTIGCWKYDFDKILLWNSKNKSIIWIYRWTHWTTQWQHAQFNWVVRCQLNGTRIDRVGVLTTRIWTQSAGSEPLLTVAEYYRFPDTWLFLVTSTRRDLRHLLLDKCLHVIIPGHLACPLPSQVHEGISCLRAHDCPPFFSLLLCLTFLLFLCTTVTLPLVLLYILVAKFFDTDFITFILIIPSCRVTRVLSVDVWQLSGNPWAKRSHLGTGPLKQQRSCKVLRLMLGVQPNSGNDTWDWSEYTWLPFGIGYH